MRNELGDPPFVLLGNYDQQGTTFVKNCRKTKESPELITGVSLTKTLTRAEYNYVITA